MMKKVMTAFVMLMVAVIVIALAVVAYDRIESAQQNVPTTASTTISTSTPSTTSVSLIEVESSVTTPSLVNSTSSVTPSLNKVTGNPKDEVEMIWLYVNSKGFFFGFEEKYEEKVTNTQRYAYIPSILELKNGRVYKPIRAWLAENKALEVKVTAVEVRKEDFYTVSTEIVEKTVMVSDLGYAHRLFDETKKGELVAILSIEFSERYYKLEVWYQEDVYALRLYGEGNKKVTPVLPTSTPEPTPTATPLPSPTATPRIPTATPEPTPTATPVPSPTATPRIPTATPEPTPTATPVPSPTATPRIPTVTPEPTLTATPVPSPTATPRIPMVTPIVSEVVVTPAATPRVTESEEIDISNDDANTINWNFIEFEENQVIDWNFENF